MNLRLTRRAGLPARPAAAALVLLAAAVGCTGEREAPHSAPAGETVRRPVIPDSILARMSPRQRGTLGRWRPLRGADEDLAARVEELESIGYVTGSRAAPDRVGVVRNDPERAWRGLNFYTSGHEPGARLVGMDGTVLHEWRSEYKKAWPDRMPEKSVISLEYWRRARLFPDGDVIAVHEGLGILRVDKDSNVLWAVHNGAHHDFDLTPDGDLLVLTRKAHIVEWVSPTRPVLEDYLTFMDPETGEEKRSISLLQAFDRSEVAPSWVEAFEAFWAKESQRHLSDSDPGDLFHTNTVEWLDGSLAAAAPAFRRGNILLSMRNLDTIAVLDPETETIVWSLSGAFTLQHEPTVAGDGTVLVFDNHWRPNRWSRIVAVDAATKAVTARYEGSDASPFYSHSCGSVAWLPNGNMLVTESDNGRTFELNAESDLVWEFYNPFRAGDSKEYIASIFEMTRLPADFPTAWAGTGGAD